MYIYGISAKDLYLENQIGGKQLNLLMYRHFLRNIIILKTRKGGKNAYNTRACTSCNSG